MISKDVAATVALRYNLSSRQAQRILDDYNNQNTQQIGMVNMEPKLRPGLPLNIYQRGNDEVISGAI